MAIINDQADLNGERLGNLYADIDAANSVANLSFDGGAAPVTITSQPDACLTGTSISSGAATGGDNVTFNVGDDNLFIFTEAATNQNTQWVRGRMNATRPTFVGAHTTGNHQWPGFGGGAIITATNGGSIMSIPGAVFTQTAASIAAGATQTNHFQGLSNSADNDFNGVIFERGALISGFANIPFVNVVMSPDSAGDGANSQGDSFRRVQQARADQSTTTLPTALWGGDFGVDFRNWTTGATSPIGSSFQIRLNATNQAGSALLNAGVFNWYVVDGMFSNEWLTNGFITINSNSNTSQTGTGNRDLPVNVIFGRSWNPIFREEFNPGTEILDVKYNLNGDTYVELDGTQVTTANPTTSVLNIVNGYTNQADPNTRRTGFMAIESTTNDISRTATNRIAIPQAVRNHNYWSYTHVCYDANRRVLNTNEQAAVWNGRMTVSNAVADLHQIDMASDAVNLAGVTLAQANSFNNGTTDSTSLDNAYAQLKAAAYNTDQDEVSYAVNATSLNITGSLTLSSTANTAVGANASTLRIPDQNTAFSGGMVYNTINVTNVFAANSPVMLSDMTIEAPGTLDASNITFGTGVTLSGDIENLAETAPAVTIATGSSITYANGTSTANRRPINLSALTLPTTGVEAVVIEGNNLAVAGVPAALQAGVVRLLGTGSIFVADPVTNVVTVPAPTSGTFAIRANKATGGDVELQAPTDLVAGTPFTLNITDFANATNPELGSFAAGDTVTFYVKYTSVPGSNTGIYQEAAQTLNFNTNGDPITYTLTQPVAQVLVNDTANPAGISVTDSLDGDDVLSVITNTAANASLEVAGPQALGLGALVANGDDYFQAWYRQRALTTDPIAAFGQGGQVAFDNRRITFGSGNFVTGSTGPRRQHTVLNWGASQDTTTNPLSRDPDGYFEVTVRPAMLATIDPAVIRQAIDSSATSAAVSEAQRGVGYLVSDGNSTTPSITGSKLGGIKPKTNDYNSGTSYEDIL